MNKFTVSFYMKGESLAFRNFDTPEEAQDFMLVLNKDPRCESYRLSRPN